MNNARPLGPDATLGIGLSGGGHRATLLGLGALLYLADAGKGSYIRTIASVSAGSITNAYLASLRNSPLTSGDAFVPHVAHLARKIAGNRKWWAASWTLMAGLAIWFLAMLLATPIDADWLQRLVPPLLGMVAVALFVGPRSGGSLWAWRGTWLWLVLVALSLIPGALLWRTAVGGWRRSVAAVVAFLLVGIAMFVRGHALRYSLSRTIAPLGSRGANRGRLEDMSTHVDHVICATELHAGTHTYFGRDFVYTREFGFGDPVGLPISTALHASASFPLVFPVCILRATKHGFRFPDVDRKPRSLMVLSDGGIFDNMADGWQLEAPDRARRLTYLNRTQKDSKVAAFVGRLKSVPQTLIVVDATPPPASSSITAALLPGITELFGVARAAGVTYNNSVQTRSRDLHARFAADSPHGAVIAGGKSPLDVVMNILDPEKVQKPGADVIERAMEAGNYLKTRFPGEDLSAFPALTIAGGTYLTPVGAERTAHILFHGYLQAMITLHVALGFPLLPNAPVRDDFRRLTSVGSAAPTAARNLSAAAV
jgi:predicted acylesterase/phospholipase RssA